MHKRDIIICIVCIALGLSLLFLASTRLDSLHKEREDMGLVVNTSLENAPPALAFATVSLGAFRGLIVDILWMRADRMKENGLFFDAKQLAEWITVLQPRFSTVWDFHAWNMAYNISVEVPREQWEERWHWVKNGYELLRDKGIQINPKSIILYRQLAYIFQHKIGGVTDDCHRDYKRELGLAMRDLLGDPMTNKLFDQLSKAPKTFEEMMKNEKVAEIINKFRAFDDSYKENIKLVNTFIELIKKPEKYSEGLQEIYNQYKDTEAFKQLEIFVKSYSLRINWKFDIELMKEINRDYGRTGIDDPNDRYPINWEHPDAHAIYWAILGLRKASRPETYSIDEKNTHRIVFHSLQKLFRQGDMVIYSVPDKPASVFLNPDLQMFDSCNAFWKLTIEKYQSLENGNPKALLGGHRNYLENCVEMFYRAGHRKKAAKIFQQLRDEYSEGIKADDYTMPLAVFVQNRVVEELDRVSDKDATEMIVFTLREAYFRYAINQDDASVSREKWAEKLYKIYQASHDDEQYRMGLPTFGEMKFIAFESFMQDQFYPENLRMMLLGRIKAEQPDLFEALQKDGQSFLQKLRKAQEQMNQMQNQN